VTHDLFVPGRLCLLGEHSDWAGEHRATHPDIPPGLCLVAGTDQGLHAEVAGHDDALVISVELAGGTRLDPVTLPQADWPEVARSGGFYRYVAGVAAGVRRRHAVGGLRLRVRADLPMQRGLSSSAAVCVLVARAFDRVYDLGLDARGEMELAYAGERSTGSICGRMDQICALGRRPSLLEFDGDELRIEPVQPGGEIALLVVDLRAAKDTPRILADLNACYPDAPDARARAVRAALGEDNRSRVLAARQALAAADARALGELMADAQAQFDRDVAPASPEELSAPRLHAVLAHPAAAELAWGGKGVGSQGDGCAQLVARDSLAREALAARLEAELDVTCLPLTIRPFREESPGDDAPHPLPSRFA
jgi:galactokinase